MISCFKQCKEIIKKVIKKDITQQYYDINLYEDIENIISDYLEYEEIKELQKKYINFKLNKSRIKEEKQFHDNGKVKQILICIDGKYNRKEDFYDDGKTKEIILYFNGELLKKEVYNIFGEKEIYNYKNNKLEGKQCIYYKTGILQKEENYIDGKKEGEQYIYTKKGKLLQKQNFVNGIEGELFEYDNKGNSINISYNRFHIIW
jgi:antitoxin component YwqK of YwqJK toxin-antitoxin module